MAILPIQQRIDQAQQLWLEGDQAMARQDLDECYTRYTQAHDLLLECPQYHRQAHQKLIVINRRVGHHWELFTDYVVMWLAPFRFLEFIAWLNSGEGRLHLSCARK